MNVTRATRRARQRGAVLVAVLVALLVVMLLSAALVRRMLGQRHELRGERQRLQAIWLADSAVARARARLEASADYQGETWQITAPLDGAPAIGRIEIQVAPAGEDPTRRTITVAAYWPDDPLQRAFEQREVPWTVTESGESP